MADNDQPVDLAEPRHLSQPARPEEARKSLAAAVLAARQGDKERAYHLSVEATRLQPDNPEAWLIRSRYARNDGERLFCLSQVNRLDPKHPAGKQESYQMLWKLLEDDPYLAYQNETDDYYLVENHRVASLAVPKDRQPVEPFPPTQPQPLKPAYTLLRLAVIGLFFAGLGTLVFAPLAMLSAMNISAQLQDPIQHTRARAVILICLALLPISVILSWLFISHLQF
jgi:hypothetical protein